MKLRIYRRWSWQLDCSPMEVKYGGVNPMKLVAHDELQVLEGHNWVPVKVVEEPKPARPGNSL